MAHPWHARALDDVLREVHSSETGLTSDDAARRLARYGANRLPRERPYSKLKLFVSQFSNPLIAILVAAALISLVIKNYPDAVFIVVVLFINTTVGFYQENKANASLAALKQLVTVRTRVSRDGAEREIDAEDLVVGDLVYLRAGDKVPADARLVSEQGLKVNEASLTGEWIASAKALSAVAPATPLAERADMVFSGTVVEEGAGTAVVVETGAQTELGKIVALLAGTMERRTPLQLKIATLSRIVGIFVLVAVALVIAIGYVTERGFAEIVIAALALAVSAIPEGLPPAITVILALGMQRILKEKGLVRKLIATETLGSVTVICTDKTGTLTEGNMQVSSILTGSAELLREGDAPLFELAKADSAASHVLALRIAALTNEAFIENQDDEFHEWVVRGRPTERALLVAATHAGFDRRALLREYPIYDRVRFDSRIKYSATLHRAPAGGRVLYVVGAPEIISSRSTALQLDSATGQLDSDEYRELLRKLEALTSTGLRVVACAYRNVPEGATGRTEDLMHDLTLVGFIALKDPLRADAKDSIALTKRAGIRTVLITGDHHLTAASIANEVGIDVPEGGVLEGSELDHLTDAELAQRALTTAIYARVSPAHKLRIVDALQAKGNVVAMVGDGVNDAPALKAADIGVAIGSGTDVAKEASDLVLLDDDFKTIVKAIEEGRVIFQNIRKVFVYLVADDFSELFIFLTAMAFGLPLPLLAAQVLWVNLVEDGLPDIALTTEQETAGVMDEKPRSPAEPLLNPPIRRWMTAIFFITGLAAFGTFVFLLQFSGDLVFTRTVVFTLVAFDSLAFAFSVRSFHKPLWRKDLFANRFLVGAALLSFLLLAAGLYLPPLQMLLNTEALSAAGWLIVLGVTAAELFFIELAKRRFFVPALRAA